METENATDSVLFNEILEELKAVNQNITEYRQYVEERDKQAYKKAAQQEQAQAEKEKAQEEKEQQQAEEEKQLAEKQQSESSTSSQSVQTLVEQSTAINQKMDNVTNVLIVSMVGVGIIIGIIACNIFSRYFKA